MDPDVTVNTSPYYDGNISFLNEISDDSDIPLFPGYPMVLLQFASACCLLFILLGIPGNLITIIALFRCKKVSFRDVLILMLNSINYIFT